MWKMINRESFIQENFDIANDVAKTETNNKNE